jgi:hypothetical protein
MCVCLFCFVLYLCHFHADTFILINYEQKKVVRGKDDVEVPNNYVCLLKGNTIEGSVKKNKSEIKLQFDGIQTNAEGLLLLLCIFFFSIFFFFSNFISRLLKLFQIES